jgi:hypothetical protein
VLEYLKIPRCDLLKFELRKLQALQPSFFLCIDWYTESLVLSIRGTMSALDTLTDLACEYEEWKGGYVHSGMKRASNWFFKNIAKEVMEHADANNLTKLNIVGHSLGGGTAAITAILFKEYFDSLKKNIQVHCYCFGSPPILSHKVANQYGDLIDSFINGNDVVPRLSYGSFQDFKSMILCAAENGDASCILKLPTGEKKKKIIEALDACRAKIACRKDALNPKVSMD